MAIINFLGGKLGVGQHALEPDLPEVIDAVMVHSSPHGPGLAKIPKIPKRYLIAILK